MYTGAVLFITFTGVLLMNILKDEVEEEITPLKKEIHHEELSQIKSEIMLKKILERLDRIEKNNPNVIESTLIHLGDAVRGN